MNDTTKLKELLGEKYTDAVLDLIWKIAYLNYEDGYAEGHMAGYDIGFEAGMDRDTIC